MLSFSGETDEITRLLPSLRAVPLIAITGKPNSTLGRQAAVTLDLGPIREACTLGLAPSTSTTAMLALGDALALVLSRMRSFGPLDYVRFHPGGSLGRKLAKVDDLMRPLDECRVALDHKTVREVFVEVSRPGRRTGAIMLTDETGLLTGIFTDSDLARLLETRRDRLIATFLLALAVPCAAQLGVIALVGMIIRNSVILVDQIERDEQRGVDTWTAIVEAAVRRCRPILLTAAASVLAMIPLSRSQFWGPMAVAIMGGLIVATVLTLLFLPALYALWFRVGRGETAVRNAGHAV